MRFHQKYKTYMHTWGQSLRGSSWRGWRVTCPSLWLEWVGLRHRHKGLWSCWKQRARGFSCYPFPKPIILQTHSSDRSSAGFRQSPQSSMWLLSYRERTLYFGIAGCAGDLCIFSLTSPQVLWELPGSSYRQITGFSKGKFFWGADAASLFSDKIQVVWNE